LLIKFIPKDIPEFNKNPYIKTAPNNIYGSTQKDIIKKIFILQLINILTD